MHVEVRSQLHPMSFRFSYLVLESGSRTGLKATLNARALQKCPGLSPSNSEVKSTLPSCTDMVFYI